MDVQQKTLYFPPMMLLIGNSLLAFAFMLSYYEEVPVLYRTGTIVAILAPFTLLLRRKILREVSESRRMRQSLAVAMLLVSLASIYLAANFKILGATVAYVTVQIGILVSFALSIFAGFVLNLRHSFSFRKCMAVFTWLISPFAAASIGYVFLGVIYYLGWGGMWS